LYTLLTCLGRSKQINKKIVKEALKETNFFERVSKQLLFSDNSPELTLAVVKTIANFGTDFKDFLQVEGLQQKLVSLIQSP
jgi:hypothetical protein